MKDSSARVMRIWMIAVVGTLLLSLCYVPPASAFTGVLNSTDLCLLGTGSWISSGPAGIKWSASRNTNDTCHYSYTLNHSGGATGDFILELGQWFGKSQILNAHGDFNLIDVGWHRALGADPAIPKPIYGIRFGDASGNVTRVEFDTWSMPTWGDFYARGDEELGKLANSVWNAGLMGEDDDPQAPARDGSVGSHILVPKAIEVTPIPEPSSLLLLGGALLGAFALRRKLS